MAMTEPGLISLDLRDGARVLTLTGEHDLATVPQLQDAIDDASAAGLPVVVDLTRAAFIDSSVIGALIAAGTAPDGGSPRYLAVVAPPDGHVARVLETIRIAGVLPTFGSAADAVSAATHRSA
jgi:anti-anti-sigma factor